MSHVWLGVALACLVVVSVVIILLRRRVLFLRLPMSSQTARARILSADREIWSFQISGGEFTAHSVEAYEEWLKADNNRRLKIAFANPENSGLLDSIVKLGGVGRFSNDDEAREHLGVIIHTSLSRYGELSRNCAHQVDVRVYDCSPPFSVHAIDPAPKKKSGSIYVEFYLPQLPARERPCALIRWDHSAYSLFTRQSLAWFEGATIVPSTSGEPAAPR